ncbi:MAG: FHA domain-containing protein [Clostridiales bacterium]|nr:FHA domain-containing protein [Clostridiales bacterium]
MWEGSEQSLTQKPHCNRNQNQTPKDDSVTVRFELPESGLDPVVGWLVCVSGKKKGQDYRLKSGFNRIGRDRKMDVVVTGDNTVSRDTHCSVVYDKKSNETYLAPGKGTLTYYKGEMVTKSRKLHSGDEIEIGQTHYIFISFCEGERSWEEK